MELKIIWEIILRRKWIIIQAFLIISLTAIIGSLLLPPVYETSAKVYAKTSDTASSLLASIGLQGVMTGGKKDVETETRMELAIVNPVLEEVISRLQLRTKNGTLMKPSELKKSKFIVSSIFPQSYVELVIVEDTDLIKITAQSSDADEAAMIANTLAGVYIEHNLGEMKEEYRSARGFIEDQIKLTKSDYFNVLNEIKQFKLAEDTVDLETETRVAIEAMADLMKKKEDNIIDISDTRAKIETLNTQLSKQSETVVSSSAISENPQIEMLKKTLADLELELAGMMTEKRPDHPDVAAINEKIARTRAELKTEIGIFQETSTTVQNFERELAALEAQRKNIDTNIKSHVSLLRAMPHKVFRESQLELKYNVSQDLYSSLLENLYQIGIAEAMAISNIRLVEPAIAPKIDKPESPKKVLNGIMGIFLGLMFGFGLGLFVDYLDDTIKTPEEAKDQGLPFLGSVPKFRRNDDPIISQRDPKDPISEAYRTIRNSLKFASTDKPLNGLLIMSSIDGEGKTITMVNLGISTAREGKSVLLVDTDLRKPRLHKVFGVSNSIGITSILAKDANPADVIKKTDITGLSLLASGPIPPDPALIIESTKMKELIKNFAEQYDIIILDSPPILLANDSVMMAGYVDSSIMIMESGRTSNKVFAHAKEILMRANVEPIGVILNKLKIGTSGYHYYYYKSGYQKGRNK